MAEKLRIMRQKEIGPADSRGGRCPSREFRSVGRRQAEQFADDGKREPSRVASNEIGRTSIGEEVCGELIGHRQDARLHVEDGAATKGFIDDAAQPRMVRLVHGEHVVGERADDARASTSEARRCHRHLCEG